VPDPHAFAACWCAAWNARDAERVLGYFHDDCVFSSPLAARLLPETGGVLRGKPALRAYWAKALAGNPDLGFTLEQVFGGVDAVAIQYRNQRGMQIAEILVFDGDRIRAGYATHLVPAGS
jgi:hypothetical protein